MLGSNQQHLLSVVETILVPVQMHSAPSSCRSSRRPSHEDDDSSGVREARAPRTASLPNCSSHRFDPDSRHQKKALASARMASCLTSPNPSSRRAHSRLTSSSSSSSCSSISSPALPRSPKAETPRPGRGHHSSLDSAALARDFFGQNSGEMDRLEIPARLDVFVPQENWSSAADRSARLRLQQSLTVASPLLSRHSYLRSVETTPAPDSQSPTETLPRSAAHPSQDNKAVMRLEVPGSSSPPECCPADGGGPSPGCGAYFRVVVLGDACVGKSTLVRQMAAAGSSWRARADGAETEDDDDGRHVIVDLQQCTLEIFDSPLDSNLDQLRPDAFVLVYSVSDRSSFCEVREVVRHLRCALGTDRPIFIVANKADLRRQQRVPAKEAKDVALAYDCFYVETSAALQLNVDKLLTKLIDHIMEQLYPPEDGALSRGFRPAKQRTFSSGKALEFFSRLFRHAVLRRSFSSDDLCLKR